MIFTRLSKTLKVTVVVLKFILFIFRKKEGRLLRTLSQLLRMFTMVCFLLLWSWLPDYVVLCFLSPLTLKGTSPIG